MSATPTMVRAAPLPNEDFLAEGSVRAELRAAHDRALAALRSIQRSDGHWCGELEGDSILQSEYILMKWILGQEDQRFVDGAGPERLTKIVNELRAQQRADGGWGQYPGSGVDISATVKAYFCLKLHGDSIDAPHMRLAREMVLAMGGAEKCNTFSMFYLACLGQVSWNAVPAIPPEIVYLPKASYFHLDKVAAWTRTMILPLAIVVTLRPTRVLRPEQSIDELFCDQVLRHRLKGKDDVPAGWKRFFAGADGALKALHAVGGSPMRKAALRRCEEWILERAGQDGVSSTAGLGAIFPPMVYLQIAFKALGYQRSDPVIRRAERELDAFMIDDGVRGADRIRIQPCFSPVWDTGIALYALADGGLDESDADAARACAWLRAKECRFRGDWVKKRRSRRPDRWLVLRVRQRVVPRRGRHGDGRDGPAPCRRRREPRRRGARAWRGSSRCRTTTAAGRRSTRPRTARFSSTSPSRITTRCRIRAVLTSPVAYSSASRGTASRSSIPRCAGRLRTSARTSFPRAASSDAGE
jgi:squalene-hopene/tetraprenyl-beta-curcumene cyclase